MGASIVSVGKALPALEIQNDDLKALVDTNDEWIRTRTGIVSRHICVSETAHSLAYSASCQALGMGNGLYPNMESVGYAPGPIDLSSVDLLIFASITPDTVVPSAAARLKMALKLDNAIAFDVNAACTGMIYAMTIAENMMAASNDPNSKVSRNRIKRALVVCSERLSKLTDWSDRNTCVLFGDGAGACLLEWTDEPTGIVSEYLRNDDDVASSLVCINEFTMDMPFSESGVTPGATDPSRRVTAEEVYGDLADDAKQAISMDGQAVFKFAGKSMSHAIQVSVDQAGLKLDDIKLFIPHQANERIIKFAAKRLDLPMDRFQLSIANTGNTSSSGVAMALTDAIVSGKVGKGDYICLVAFGGGLTSGAVVIKL